MNRIYLALLAAFGSQSQTGVASRQYTLVQANLFFYRLVRWTLILIGLVLFGYGLNLLGWEKANFVISLFLAIASLIVWSRPVNVGFAAEIYIVIEVLRNNSSLNNGAEKFLKFWADSLSNFLLYLSLTFLALGSISGRENWFAVAPILCTLILFIYYNKVWGLKFDRWKKICYYFTVFILIVNLASLVPGAIWNKVGANPFSYFETNEVDHRVVSTEKIIENNINKYHSQLLEVAEKTANGVKDEKKDTTALLYAYADKKNAHDAKALLDEVKNERYRNSLGGLYKQVRDSFNNLPGVEEAENNPDIVITKHSKYSWTIKFLTGKKTYVLNRWPKGTTIVFSGFEKGKVSQDDPAGKDDSFPLSANKPLGRNVDTSLRLQYEFGKEVKLNFSQGV